MNEEKWIVQKNNLSAMPAFSSIYFATASYQLNDQNKQIVHAYIDWLKQFPSITVIIEGHCDARGNTDYNLELGDRRARAVMAYMISHGIHPYRMIPMSYGESQPLEGAHYSKNRRVVLGRR